MKKLTLRKKIVLILGIVLGICLVTGTVFAVLRPAYVQEAVQILFENEMNRPLEEEQPPEESQRPGREYSDEVKHPGVGQTVPKFPQNESSKQESSEEEDD